MCVSFFFKITLPGTPPALSVCRLTFFWSEKISTVRYSSYSSSLELFLPLEPLTFTAWGKRHPKSVFLSGIPPLCFWSLRHTLFLSFEIYPFLHFMF